jgi:hypothetical protein
MDNMDDVQNKIKVTAKEVMDLLLKKNKQYGNSVFEPLGIFSKGVPMESLRVRIDDKLSRLMRGNDSIEQDEDIVKDLIGYLILLLIMMREQ